MLNNQFILSPAPVGKKQESSNSPGKTKSKSPQVIPVMTNKEKTQVE
jgi:hypothetical protein